MLRNLGAESSTASVQANIANICFPNDVQECRSHFPTLTDAKKENVFLLRKKREGTMPQFLFLQVFFNFV